MGLRFAYGLANAVSTATITRMDEGDESHKGGRFKEGFGSKPLHPFALQKQCRGVKGPNTGGTGLPQGASTGKMPDLAEWRRQSATSDRRLL